MASLELDNRRLIREAWLCSVAALLLTIATALPVVRHPSTVLFGAELVGRHYDPYTVMEQYVAGAVPTPYWQPATDVPGVVLTRLIGPVRAYNLLLFLTFPLAAFFAHAHARYVGATRIGAIVAALLFAFAPVHLAHAAYHLHVAQVQWVPLAFLALWHLLDRPTLARAAGLCAAVGLAAASGFYLGLVVAVTLPIAAVSAAALNPRGRRAAAGWTAAALAVAVVIGCEIVRVATSTIAMLAAARFPLSALEPHSARLWSYLTPSIGHPWFGPSALAFWRSKGIDEGLLEQQVTVGFGVLALAAVPFLARGRPGVLPRARGALLIIAAVAVLLSLPPDFNIGLTHIVMPARWLYAVAPVFRSYARFAIVVSLALTTLAGVGFGILFDRGTGTAKACAIVLLAVAVCEYLPPSHNWRNTLPTAGHAWLAGQPDARVLDCIAPSPGATAGLAMLMRHEVSFLAGPFPDCGEPDLGDKLAAFHYTHVLARSGDDMWPWIAAGGTPDGTRPSARFADAAVFVVTAREPRIYVSGVQGFYPREFAEQGSWRWMADRGSLTVVQRRAESFDAIFEAELEGFARPRIVEVTLDGTRIATLTVDRDLRWHTIATLRIPVGSHVVAFRADPTLVSDVMAGTRDPRRLSIRLGRWRWRPVG